MHSLQRDWKGHQEIWADGRHRADKDWMTGMARAAVRMGTWRLDTQG